MEIHQLKKIKEFFNKCFAAKMRWVFIFIFLAVSDLGVFSQHYNGDTFFTSYETRGQQPDVATDANQEEDRK